MTKNLSRRGFVHRSGQIALGAVAAGSVLAAPKRASAVEFEGDAKAEGICLTCAFWGGIRRVSDDGKKVVAESLGYCNNPKSEHYRMSTTPTTGPMKSWTRWPALA
jgi:anaerobic selenocysteine-containing dehydrogenase